MTWHHLKSYLKVFALLAVVALAAGLLYIQASGSKMLSVQSGSMVPAFHRGDIVTVNSIPVSKLAVGDVITFVNPHNSKQTITHRIAQLPSSDNGHKLTTKGDANPTTDTPINPSAVIGEVHHRLPYAGFAIDFVRQPLGLLIAIYVPALLIVIEELRQLSAYYKSQQPYKVPGRDKSSGNPILGRRFKSGVAVSILCLCAGLSVTLPAGADLMSKATLTGTTISITPKTSHILLRQVEFECSLDNTNTVNKLPSILFYNPTKADISTGGWYLQSSKGRILTFRPQTVFDAKSNYDIEPDLKDGVNYAGDFLALFDASGHMVDAISWGTDTTYLSPSLPIIGDGTVFKRFNVLLDTDTAADWSVTVNSCTAR